MRIKALQGLICGDIQDHENCLKGTCCVLIRTLVLSHAGCRGPGRLSVSESSPSSDWLMALRRRFSATSSAYEDVDPLLELHTDSLSDFKAPMVASNACFTRPMRNKKKRRMLENLAQMHHRNPGVQVRCELPLLSSLV